MSDFVKKFLFKAAEFHFGIDFSETGQTDQSDELHNFINKQETITLYGFPTNSNKNFEFTTKTPNACNKFIVFTKIKTTSLSNEDNLSDLIQITPVFGSPALALFHSLNHVFNPLLNQIQDASIQRNLANLQANLRASLLSSSTTDSDLASFITVDNLQHELDYWDNTGKTSKNRLARTSANSFRDILRSIVNDFSVIEALPVQEVEDLLENAHNVLDDLWRHEPPFPFDRIKHLMDLIGDDVTKVVAKQLKSCNIWIDSYSTVSEVMNQCLNLVERWLKSCEELTKIFWSNYSNNIWKDPVYLPSNLVTLKKRLLDLINIQTISKQIIRLLTQQEQDNLQTSNLFNPFTKINYLEFGEYSNKLWLQAHKEFEYLLQPAEKTVANKLKTQLSRINTNTRHLLHEFTRYSELINRPVVKEALKNERQFLLTSLYDYVRQLQTINQEEVQTSKYQTPQIVTEVMAAKQLESRALEVEKTSKKLLNDLQGFDNLQQVVNELLKDMKQQHTELYESWTQEMTALIKSGVLNLKESDPVVQFSTNQLMKVNYSNRLVELITEVRQFRALGYKIPSNIEQTSEVARKFMQLARTLEQIAVFHNTIGDRMIVCQRPMMLSSALVLSKLVQEEKVVSWGDTKSVEDYVEVLKKSVEKLSKENQTLTSYYHQINEKIKSLEDVDLIKDYSKWKNAAKQIRELIVQVEIKGFQNMQNWLLDIDNNLCNVLEKEYLKSLATVHLYLPEIYTDIVYRKQELQFSPDIETLKEKYQMQLKQFIDIPKNFRGIDESSTFSKILETNNEHFQKMTKHTEELFNQLQATLNHWKSWLQLNPLDVSTLKIWQHWDSNFRASKAFGQEVAKLPSNTECIGCFIIGLSRLQSDLEMQNRSFWDQLVLSLKDSIAEDVVKLQNYVDPSTAALTRQAYTVEEVDQSGIAHANILKQADEMEKCFEEMMQKAKILASWTRETVDSVNRLKGAWERLQGLLENHQHIIAKQMETIRTSLRINWDNLEKEVERFEAKWEQSKLKPGQIAEISIEKLYKQFLSIQEKCNQWKEIGEKQENLLLDYEKFNFEKPQFKSSTHLEEDLTQEIETWNVFNQFYLNLDKIQKEEWILFRKKIYLLGDFLTECEQNIKNQTTNQELITRILQENKKYAEILPHLKYLRGEDFTDKHWLEVYNLLQIPFKPIEQLLVGDFLNASSKILQLGNELQAICKKAASEIVVRQALGELEQWDIEARFVLTDHINSKNVTIHLIKDFKDILNKLGDNQSLLQSVKNSADYESFSERASHWENKLATLDQNITALAQIQRKWAYLEPIFGSGTLEHEKQRFEKIDKDFNNVLTSIQKDSQVSALYRYPNLSTVLKNLQEQLVRCQKSLDAFLDEKRSKFPRFLFLGDDDLLEVVGQSSKEQVMQTHLKKLFAGINSIELNSEGNKITAICSLQGEKVPLATPISVNAPVENWLNNLVKEMQTTLKNLLAQCLLDGQSPDPLKYPSQILCLTDNILFTQKTEQGISSITLPLLLSNYKAQLQHLSSLELKLVEEQDNVLELKLKSLLIDTIHHIQILEELLEANITKINDWLWQKQLRFYSNAKGEVTIKMAKAQLPYSHEYLGNTQKLIRTPLTDRCFLTLTQGMHLGMGGNPYGPAGTGKTESVKALGQLLGRQVLVFNCDEGIDSASIGRILSGLVRSGAWGCFDEFNRLDEATLSAVSMQIQPIQEALRTKATKLHFLGTEIDVNCHCGIFVTLNPAGSEYGGRNKLPDNLKQLFRPVVMTHPNQEQIARNLLLCDGYQNAPLIAKKIIEVFNASQKMLSHQQHYDWSLRSIRTILGGCGRALKDHRKNNNEAAGNQLLTELTQVVKVLRINTMSKLTFDDSLKFESLIQDVFCNVTLEENQTDPLIEALKESCLEFNLGVNEKQIQKCLELHEQLKQRMGVAIVGPPSSGKSTIRLLLFHALSKLGKQIKQYSFNPKSITKSELLGQIDVDTRQWNDGVLTLYSLEVTSSSQDQNFWIVCDGNIDPEWVESLNSVLDDNRLLTLPSGWRIQFGLNVNFIFETHSLSSASPATVSRMGIVFLSENDLNFNDFITHFIKQQSDEWQILLSSLIIDYFAKAVTWIIEEGELVLEASKISIARTGLSMLHQVSSKNDFLVAIINGLGQLLQFDFREVFSQQVFEWSNEIPPPILTKICYNKGRDSIESYYTNPSLKVNSGSSKLSLVLTGDVQKTINCLKLYLQFGKEEHFLLVGPRGSAKSLIVEHLIKMHSDLEMVTIHCSGSLSPSYIVNKITQSCILVNTNKGKMYKPKRGNLVLYLKNLHLLKEDTWGTNIVIEFLHQIITYKAFFDTNLELVGFERITIIATLSSNQTLSSRFISIINVFNIDQPDSEDLAVIVVAYLTSLINQAFKELPKAKIVKLASTLIIIYEKIKAAFAPSQYKHYNFTPHDLTSWCASIVNYSEFLKENDENALYEAFAYEGLKRFGNKLVHEEERQKLKHLINDTFKITLTNQAYFVPISKSSQFLRFNVEEWEEIVNKGIGQYAREGQDLSLIINTELLDLTASLARTLSEKKTHAVLIGRSGIGRKSSVKIVSALQGAKLCQLPFSNSQLELKQAMHSAGIENEIVYLLLEDDNLRSDFLSTVNILINAGECPQLYNQIELESIVSGLRDEANRENYDGNLINFFEKRIQNNLHVIVCLDVDNKNMWMILEQCPALLHQSIIIWKSSWSIETIKIIPEEMIGQDNTMAACLNFPKIFEIVALKSAEPSRYVSLIQLYKSIYKEKKNTISSKQEKLRAGVTKLNDAAESVTKLKQKAADQQEKLAEKQSKANQALDMISNTMKNANSHKEEMSVLKSKTELENETLIERKQAIEIELAQVEPLIQQARQAVGNIRPEALSEIRSLRAPPDVIRDILEGVLRLMGIQDTSWNSMKTFLSKRGIKEEIRSFDASRITAENRQAVERLIKNKSDSFEEKSAKRASLAAAPLAAWVAANVKYSHVVEKIKPLEREQHKLKENLANAENQLGELSAGLLNVDETVAKLKRQLAAFTKEAAEIEIDLNKAQETLATAEELVSKLDEEHKRWKTQLEELDTDFKQLPNLCLIASAFITYLSDEDEDGRQRIVRLWCKATGINAFKLESFLSSERELLRWQSEGLTLDSQSVQNAIIIQKSKITPLLIDPTSNAINWYKNHYKNKQLEVISQNSPKFQSNLELAVRFGKILIIEEIEEISAILFPILRQEFIFQGERKLINLNGKLIDLHTNFVLILTSRNEHLKISSNFSGVVSTMNFTVTHYGLCEQLMAAAIKQEKPELGERRKELLSSKENLQEKQFQLQNQLLEDLVNSSGNILHNSKLLISLNETKASSTAINQSLLESLQIQKKIEKEYEIYKDISLFASSLFFACNEFTKYNVLYVLSVKTFTKLFLTSLQTFQAINESLEAQKKHVFQTVYTYSIRGIFKNDRLTFALNLTQKVFKIPRNEWNVFIGNFVTKSDADLPPWIPQQSHNLLLNLQLSCPELYNSLQLKEQTLWNRFMSSSHCEKDFPTHCKLSDFQKVLLIQILRPDRCCTMMTQCVLNVTGLRSIDSPVFDLNQIIKELQENEPILILTVAGSDPSKEIQQLAGDQEVVEVAMGEGQENDALQALKAVASSGQWIILKNLHLVPFWLGILCQNLQNLSPNPTFKLWLITEATPKFNFVLAQNSLKVVYEAPQGLKCNLQRSLNTYTPKFFEKLSGTSARIFFILCTLHAILQERRKYIPQGWSKYYEFSDTDLTTILKLVEEVWSGSSHPIQWSFIGGLCKEAVYGGRIENEDDLKILQTYLHQFLNDEVLSHRWSFINITFPSSAKFADYYKAVKELPDKDLPAFFGLPENIERAWEKQTTGKIITNLKSLYLIKESNNFDRDLWQKSLAPFMILWKKLNQGLDFIRMVVSTTNGLSPVDHFLSEELQIAIGLIKKIHKSFASLNKICKGSALPSDSDLTTGASLIRFEVPKSWSKVYKGPKDPNRYLKNLLTKTISISKWNKESFSQLVKEPINLSNLLRPEAFLACYKQEMAQFYKVAMDQLELETSWKLPPSSKKYLILNNLLIEGGSYDDGSLKQSVSNSDSVSSAPNCYVFWEEKAKNLRSDKRFSVPLYQDSSREKMIAGIEINCNDREKDEWIQAALAFYLEI